MLNKNLFMHHKTQFLPKFVLARFFVRFSLAIVSLPSSQFVSSSIVRTLNRRVIDWCICRQICWHCVHGIWSPMPSMLKTSQNGSQMSVRRLIGSYFWSPLKRQKFIFYRNDNRALVEWVFWIRYEKVIILF